MSDTITLTLTFDRQHLEGIARSHAMLRQEPRLPISTKDLRAALDAQEVQPLQPIDDEVEAFRKRFFERTGERLQRTAVVEGLRAALGGEADRLRRALRDVNAHIGVSTSSPTEEVIRAVVESALRLADEEALESVGEEPCKRCGGRGFNFGAEADGMLRCEACNGTGQRQPEDETESTE